MKLPINLIYIISFVVITISSGCKNTANPATINTHAYTEPVVTGTDHVALGGIPNLGATCYMNSVLQILKSFYLAKINEQNDTLGRSLQGLFQTIAADQAVATEDQARNVFKALSPQLGWTSDPGTQQDAQELITGLFSWMELPLASTESKFIKLSTDEERATAGYPWSIHHVELPTQKDQTLSMQDLFDRNIASEFVYVKFRDTDTSDSQAQKFKEFKDLDHLHNKILVLQLKRFETKGGARLPNGTYSPDFTKRKLTQAIQNPMRLVIKRNQTAEKDRDRNYTIVGFIQHLGDIDSGHYVTYVKKDDKWVCYNDSHVEVVSDKIAEQNAQLAYLFFYQPS